jgi:predicted nucleic acid-binding protein
VTRFVVDASVAIKWVVDEPGTAQALRLLRHPLSAPDLLIAECTNILWKKVRRGELSDQEAVVTTGLLRGADVTLEPMSALMEPTLRLALRLGNAAYDCFYLALAELTGTAFVTADEVLVRRVRSAGLPLVVHSLGEALQG